MRAAARYYEEREPGLGEEFLQEAEQAARIATEHPAAGTPLSGGFRWLLTRRFHYALIYREGFGAIQVVAVAHLRRRPGFWRSRR